MAGFGLLYSIFDFSDISIIQSIIGAIVGFAVFEILSKIGELFANIRMFGEGDSLIALALGAIFGFKPLLIIIALSFIVQTLFAIPVLIFNTFKEKKYKLCFTYFSVIFSLLFIIAINIFNLIENYNLYMTLTIVISLLMIYALKNIFSEIRKKTELFDKEDDIDDVLQKSTFSIMPFGPALIISAFICIFYLDSIKQIILQFIY